METMRGQKFELALTIEQANLLSQWLGTCRLLWNLAFTQRDMNYNQFRKRMTYGEQSAELVALKKEFPFFKSVPHHCLQQKLRDLQTAFDRFFSGSAQYPCSKRKGRSIDSIRFPSPDKFDISQTKKIRTRKDGKELVKGYGIVDLPKIGKLKFRQSQTIIGKVRNATITRHSGKWFISFTVEELMVRKKAKTSEVGIDRGVHQMGMTSLGEVLELPTAGLQLIEKRIAQSQRRLRRKRKFSNNWVKAQKHIAKLHSKLTNIRKDQIHKITSDIAKNHSFVAIEDLRIKNMTASAAGTNEDPGSMVRQKSGLNRSILRQGWGYFGQWLEYKVAWHQGTLVRVPPAYTSQTCSVCLAVDSASRDRLRFRCVSCGHEDHADVNAAKNILKVGLDIAQSSEKSGKPVEKLRKQLRRSRNQKARKSQSPAA
jgi:putative transposase